MSVILGIASGTLVGLVAALLYENILSKRAKDGGIKPSATPPPIKSKDEEERPPASGITNEYRRGVEAGIIEERRKMSGRCYNEIALLLDRRGAGNAEELADYICQIIKGFSADEVDEVEPVEEDAPGDCQWR